jgi:small multidrug resistance pump
VKLIAIAGALVFEQAPDAPAIIGMVLIVAGVVIINVFSKTISH